MSRKRKEIKSCIYQIRNKVNNHIYVGSCKIFSRRKAFHLFTLRRGNHCNTYLQRAWKKYGEENFVFEIIEKVIDITNLISREQYYIDNLRPQYNSRRVADSNINNKRVMTDKEKRASAERNKKFRKLTDNQVRELQKIREEGLGIKKISEMFNLEESVVSRILSGKRYKELYRPIKKFIVNNRVPVEKKDKIVELLSIGIPYRKVAKILQVSESYVFNTKKKINKNVEIM